MMYEEITKQANTIVSELLEQANLKPGSLFVVGCSSSEMVGQRIGKGSSMEAAQAAYKGIAPLLKEKDSAKAEKILQAFEKRGPSHPNPGEVESERRLILTAKEKAAQPEA